MAKIGVVLVATATFVAGAIAGGLAVGWFINAAVIEPSTKWAATAGVSTKVTVLASIRSGEIEKARDLLESLLDGDIITLGMVQGSKRDEDVERAVARAAEYREKHPHSSGYAEADQTVQQILSGRAASAKEREQ